MLVPYMMKSAVFGGKSSSPSFLPALSGVLNGEGSRSRPGILPRFSLWKDFLAWGSLLSSIFCWMVVWISEMN